jgi:hypothetical protein
MLGTNKLYADMQFIQEQKDDQVGSPGSLTDVP